MGITNEDDLIMAKQLRKHGETMWTQERRLPNTTWADQYMMNRLTRLRHDFNKNRIRIASGVDQ